MGQKTWRQYYYLYRYWLILFWPWEVFLVMLGHIGVGALISKLFLGRLRSRRGLTEQEKELAYFMYGEQPWIEHTYICERSWIAKWLRIAFVFMDTIFIGRPIDKGTLVHELMHRHQYQEIGLKYIPRCLYAQWLGGGYTLPHHPIVQKILLGAKSISHLNYEQQAVLMEQLWEQRIRGIADHRVRIDLSIA